MVVRIEPAVVGGAEAAEGAQFDHSLGSSLEGIREMEIGIAPLRWN
jgi:hypothetical protein